MTTIKFYDGNNRAYETLDIPVDEYWERVDDGKHLMFREKVGDKTLTIRLPLGSWDIMDALIPKILKYSPGDIVEIGMGESTQLFADHAYQANVRLYSCDIQMGGMFEVFKKKLFLDHICYIGRSEEFMREYDGYASIVFLDGEHRYESVKKEVDFFLPRLLPGGVMFLHDTFPPYERQIKPDDKGWSPGDVYKVRQELERMPEYDVFTWPYSAHDMGLTMVMNHGKRDEYWKQNGRCL